MTDYLIDTHAHLDFPELYDRLDEVLDNAKKNNVKRIISISTNLNKIDKIPSKQVSFYLLNQFILSSFSASKISLKELNK